MNNKTKMTFSIASVAILTLMTGQMASATTFASWPSGTQYYYCTSSFENDLLHSTKVNPCGDLDYSADKWNNVSGSSWNFNEHTSLSGRSACQVFSFPVL